MLQEQENRAKENPPEKYTNACSLGNKQEELKLHMQMLNCDIIDAAVTEMWWDSLLNVSAAMH